MQEQTGVTVVVARTCVSECVRSWDGTTAPLMVHISLEIARFFSNDVKKGITKVQNLITS